MNKAVLVRVTGRVQGVGFRYSACRQARRLGLTGWVRNERDGAVTSLVQGLPDLVQELVIWFKKGPAGAVIEEALIVESAFENNLNDFDILY